MKDVIKIVIAVCLLVFSVQIVNAQQVFISQDFEDPLQWIGLGTRLSLFWEQ